MQQVQLAFDFAPVPDATPPALTSPHPPKASSAQWRETKERHPDALVLLVTERTVQTYEDDALTTAAALGLNATHGVLTFARADLEQCLSALAHAGYRIAIVTSTASVPDGDCADLPCAGARIPPPPVQEAYTPMDGWRENLFKARRYATALGLIHRGKSLQEIVGEIDATLARRPDHILGVMNGDEHPGIGDLFTPATE
jgi:MutS-like protein